MGNIGFKEILLILVVVLLVFGTKKLKNIGSDLGGAVKGFKKAMSDGESEEQASQAAAAKQIEGGAAKDAQFPEVGAGTRSGQKSGPA
jgi:sec-independent protein translocase protein TatA